MYEEIGDVAGKIWHYLNEKEKYRVSQLPRALKVKKPLVFQGLGWLARENKITWKTEKSVTYVSLIDRMLKK